MGLPSEFGRNGSQQLYIVKLYRKYSYTTTSLLIWGSQVYTCASDKFNTLLGNTPVQKLRCQQLYWGSCFGRQLGKFDTTGGLA